MAVCDLNSSKTQIFSKFIHVVAHIVFHSFMWLNNISLYGYSTSHLPIYVWMGIELFPPLSYE